MSTTTQAKEVKIWNVNGIINREKRAAKVPAEVSEKNILSKTSRRNRLDFDYNENKTFRHYESNDLGVLKIPEASKHNKSNNIYEKRARLIIANKENSKPKQQAAPKKPVEEKKVVEKQEAAPAVDEATKSTTPVRKRKSSLKGGPTPTLSDKVMQQIARLGGKLQTGIAPRIYNNQKEALPAQLQLFLDVAWTNNKFLLNEANVELVEFKLEDEEWEDIEFLAAHKESAVLFSDGDDLACFLTTEVSEDPTVYILPNEGAAKKTTLSKYLARLSPAQ